MVRPNESEEAATGNGESETSAGTHAQTRTYKERTGLYKTCMEMLFVVHDSLVTRMGNHVNFHVGELNYL